jgi:hypothetical protein
MKPRLLVLVFATLAVSVGACETNPPTFSFGVPPSSPVHVFGTVVGAYRIPLTGAYVDRSCYKFTDQLCPPEGHRRVWDRNAPSGIYSYSVDIRPCAADVGCAVEHRAVSREVYAEIAAGARVVTIDGRPYDVQGAS